VDCDSQQGKQLLTALTQEKYLLYVLTCSVDSFGFFFFFFSFFTLSVVVVDVYGTMKSNLVLSLLFFFSVIFFIAVINLCLYVGLWQFCAISLSFVFYI